MFTLRDVSLTLDLPVVSREKWARALPPLCAALDVRLANEPSSERRSVDLLADIAEMWRGSSQQLYGVTFNLFDSEQHVLQTFGAAGMQANLIRAPTGELLFRSSDAGQTAFALRNLDAEALHMFFATDTAEAVRTVALAGQYSAPYTLPEAPYLGRLDVHGGIMSYDGADAIYVLGTPDFVVRRCLGALLSVLRLDCLVS